MSLSTFLFPPVFEDAWEWPVINYNFKNDLIFSYFLIDNLIDVKFSNYMPILYNIFLMPLLDVSNSFAMNFQIFLTVLTSLLFYLSAKTLYNFRVALIFLLIFSFFPLNVYSNIKFSNINLFLFFLSILTLFFVKYLNDKNIYNLVIINIAACLCILTRSEFLLLYFFLIVYLIFLKKINLKYFLSSLIIFLICLSPFILRNLNAHGKIIITAESFGINLWRGWFEPNTSNSKNINSIRNDGTSKLLSKETNQKIKNLDVKNNWESNLNDIYLNEAIQNIKKNYLEVPIILFNRAFSILFWFVDHDYKNANHFLIVIPWIFLVINFLVSLKRNYRNYFDLKKNYLEKYFLFYIIYYIFLFSVFFVIPRYKLFLLPFISIIAAENIDYYLNKSQLYKKIFVKYE